MTFTIRRQIAALAVAGFLLVLASGAIGYGGTVALGDQQRSARNAAAALQGVQSTAIAQALFRGNVLASLVTNNATERQEVLDKLGENVAHARAGVDDVARYMPELRGQADAALSALDELVASGQRIVTLASRVASDPGRTAALAARPAYDQVDVKAGEAIEALRSAITPRCGRRTRARHPRPPTSNGWCWSPVCWPRSCWAVRRCGWAVASPAG